MFDEVNRRIAAVVSSYPKLCFFSSILFAIFFSSSLYRCTIEKDIRRSFSPPNSRSSREERIHAEFYNLTASPERAFILFYTKDGSSMLQDEHIEEMFRIDEILRSKIRVDDGRGVHMCEPLCELNAAIVLFWKELKGRREWTGLDDMDNSTVFDFPTSRIFEHDVFMGMNMFGVQTSDQLFANRSRITHVDTVVLWYFWQTDNIEQREILRQTALQMFAMSKARNHSKLLNFDIFSDELANAEMMRGAFEATKLMIIGFFLLLAFVFAVVWRKVKFRALPSVVFATVLSPFLAAVTAFGILSWLKFPIYSIMCVTPFLILGIGVDDAFIMLQSWVHLREITDKKERLSRVFVDIGPSVSITSITNTIAFGIGYLTPTPQMSVFCLCTSLACLIDYVLTFSLFAPVLLTCGGTTFEYQQAPNRVSGSPKKKKTDSIGWYASLLCSWKCKFVVFGLLTSLYAVSTYGVLGMRSTFEPDKAFPSNSPLMHSLQGIKTVFTEFFPLQVIVSRPPNISNSQEYSEFYEMVSALEAVPRSYGRERTLLFLKTYEEFERKAFDMYQFFGLMDAVEFTPSYDGLAFYLQHIGNNISVRFHKDERGQSRPKAFQMTIVAHDMSEWSHRAIYVEQCRGVVAKYPQFNASVYDGESSILDLILTVKTDLIGSVAVTVLCMAAVCLFFIANRTGLLIITFTISSICFTLIGGLSWWGADLDPVTMVDVLIATGFSVDYTAHIAYKFYKARGDPFDRVRESLQEMSPPMLQAGLSTVLCMLPLIYVPTYAILAFAKTIFLVVGLGLLHGLFILPVLLVTFSRRAPEVPLPAKVALDEVERRNDRLLL